MSYLHYEKFANGTVKCMEEEIPFELPEGWEWEKFNFIADMAWDKILDESRNKGTLRLYLRNINVR